jgi:Family of unknown function (DUF5317)
MKRELRLYFPKVQIKSGVLALFALAIQAIAIFVPLGLDDLPKRLLFVLSYVLLLAFIVVNLRRPGIAVIGIGVVLNLLPIVANGGLMPVTAENVARIGETSSIEGREDGDAIPYTKNVLKSKDDTWFYELSDRIVWDNPFFFRIFSIGDVVIAGGLALTMGELFLPRVKREAEAHKSASRANP